ncbi:MAG: hypothetical protein GWO02_21205, partial [Gammaproteobacteria bacterium]|nr:hypothetical protein [Gammaproteobacteria bacterium]
MKERRPIPPRSLGRAFAAFFVACLPLFAGVAEDAERAWNAGDHAAALELYEQVLAD